MSILGQLKVDQLAARKDRNSELVTTLTTLMSEIADVGLNDGKRETTDGEALVVIQKFVKNLKESIAHQDSYDKQVELHLYLSYLPRMLTEAELELKIAEYIALGNGNMGMIMKELKTSGQWYDGKQASAVAKRLLSA
jgi:uncharacterized protein YqeY